jgi:hypothetical protein
MKATARKAAVCYYDVMTKGVEYVEYGIHLFEQALSLGFNLIPRLE